MKKYCYLLFVFAVLLPSLAFAKEKWLGGTYTLRGDTIYSTMASGNGEISVRGADIRTFRVIQGIFARDQYNIYIQWSSPADLDCRSFKPLSKTFSRDRYQIYWLADRVVGVDLQTFKPLSFSYGKDAKSVYVSGKRIEWADPKTFRVIEDAPASAAFWQDKDAIYSGTKKTAHDAKTFVRKGIYNRDKNGVTCESQFVQKLEGFDVKTFQVLKNGYAKDKNAVYKDCKKLEWVSPKGFQAPTL